jgi:hypothetical protein
MLFLLFQCGLRCQNGNQHTRWYAAWQGGSGGQKSARAFDRYGAKASISPKKWVETLSIFL